MRKVKHLFRSFSARVTLFASIGALSLTPAVSGTPATDFSVDYSDVFCGKPLLTSPRPAPVIVPPHATPLMVDVNIDANAFVPPNLTINAGDTVRWTNNHVGRTHTSTSDTAVWDSGNLLTGQSFSFTFNNPGTFPYHCNVHSFMTASITVLPAGPTVSISGFAFNPPELVINVGDTVTWVNNDGPDHTTTSDTAVWDSGVLSLGQTFSFTFTSAGTFPYHCDIHPSMTANITVIESSSPTPTPTGTPTGTSTSTPTPTASGTSSPTATSTPNTPPSISGTVTYGNAAAPPKFISNVSVTGTGSANVFTTTGAPGPNAGQYSLTGFGAGSYTVSLSKTTGQNSITSNDCARIAQHVAGISFFTTNNQRVTADVTNNGAISSQDAAKVAQVVAGLPLSPPNLTGQWRFFLPPGPTFPIGSSPTSRTYPSITSSITGDDYVGLLMGEATGNWTPSAARPVSSRQSASSRGPERGAAVELPNMETTVGKEIVVPVNVQGAANKEIISYEFDLRYDPSVIQPSADPVAVKGTASRGLSVVTNPNEPGLLRVVVYGAFPIDSDGVLLDLRFIAIGKPGAISPLTWERIMFNEGEPRVSTINGQIELF